MSSRPLLLLSTPSLQFKGSVKDPNMFHNYETEKLTCKASDATENLQLHLVLQPEIVMHERPPIYASCMTISGGRTKQLDIIAGFLPHHWLYE